MYIVCMCMCVFVCVCVCVCVCVVCVVFQISAYRATQMKRKRKWEKKMVLADAFSTRYLRSQTLFLFHMCAKKTLYATHTNTRARTHTQSANTHTHTYPPTPSSGCLLTSSTSGYLHQFTRTTPAFPAICVGL